MPLNIDFQQILLHFFNFAILMGGLYFLLYAPVKKFMDGRMESYEKMDEDAKNNLSQAEKTRLEYEKKLSDAEEEIKEKKAKAEKELKASLDEKIQESKAEAERIIKEAHDQTVREHNKMIMDSKEEIVDLAVEMTEKVMLTAEDPYEQFLDIAEKRMKQ